MNTLPRTSVAVLSVMVNLCALSESSANHRAPSVASTVNLLVVQTCKKPSGYQVMFFVDAICQQYFIPIPQKFQHFLLSHIHSFIFSFP